MRLAVVDAAPAGLHARLAALGAVSPLEPEPPPILGQVGHPTPRVGLKTDAELVAMSGRLERGAPHREPWKG